MHKIPFNMNYWVEVKLTPMGRSIIKEKMDSINKHIITRGGVPLKEHMVEEDGEGFSRWQLWHLFETFGDYCGLGGHLPFHADFRICVEDKNYFEKVYVLMADGDGTMRSVPRPIGYAVRTKEEAEKFTESNYSYDDTYESVIVVEYDEYMLGIKKN